MPLTKKGRRILAEMIKEYGEDKGEEVFYASINKGTITGAEAPKHHGARHQRARKAARRRRARLKSHHSRS